MAAPFESKMGASNMSSLSKRRVVLVRLAAGFLAAIGAMLAGMHWTQVRALEHEEDLARKAGLAITYDEWLRGFPPIPDEQNAGLVYQQMKRAMGEQRRSRLAEFVETPVTLEHRQIVTQNEELLKLGGHAANRIQCRAPEDQRLARGIESKVHENMRDTALLFQLRANTVASANPAQAAQDMGRSLMILRHLRQCPRLIVEMRTAWLEFQVWQNIASVCASQPKEKRFQTVLRKALADPGPNWRAIIKAVLVEELMVLDMRDARSWYGLKPEDRVPWEAYRDAFLQPTIVGRRFVVKGYRLEAEALELTGAARYTKMEEGAELVVKGMRSFPGVAPVAHLEIERVRRIRDHAVSREQHRIAYSVLLRALETGMPPKSLDVSKWKDPISGLPPKVLLRWQEDRHLCRHSPL